MKKLTDRELQVVQLLIEGLTNKEIANNLFISVHTVKTILETLFQKFEVINRVQLAILLDRNLNR